MTTTTNAITGATTSAVTFSTPVFNNGVMSFDVIAGQAMTDFDFVLTYDKNQLASLAEPMAIVFSIPEP